MMQVARGGRIFCPKNCASFSPSTSKTSFAEGRNGVWVSNFQRRGRSQAASVPSDTPNPQNARKRVPKKERYAMVASFVSKYKLNHAGKFPTVSVVQKEVGGSYYTIRKMLQELEYKSKLCSSDNKTEKLSEKEVPKEVESLAEGEVVSPAVGIQDGSQTVAMGNQLEAEGELKVEMTLSQELVKLHSSDGNDFVLEESKLLKGDEGTFEKSKNNTREDFQKASDNLLEVPEDGKLEEIEGIRLQDVLEQDLDTFSTEIHHLKEKVEKPSDQHLEMTVDGKEEEIQGAQAKISAVKSQPKEETELEDSEEDKKQEIVSQNLLDSDGREIKVKKNQQSMEDEKSVKNISSQQTNDARLKNSTLWEDLKSLADRFVNMWKKF
ncbi:hypothetical protein SLE2022_294440 [Rubroshorea leprosula]